MTHQCWTRWWRGRSGARRRLRHREHGRGPSSLSSPRDERYRGSWRAERAWSDADNQPSRHAARAVRGALTLKLCALDACQRQRDLGVLKETSSGCAPAHGTPGRAQDSGRYNSKSSGRCSVLLATARLTPGSALGRPQWHSEQPHAEPHGRPRRSGPENTRAYGAHCRPRRCRRRHAQPISRTPNGKVCRSSVGGAVWMR